jgi:hypothetical protein
MSDGLTLGQRPTCFFPTGASICAWRTHFGRRCSGMYDQVSYALRGERFFILSTSFILALGPSQLHIHGSIQNIPDWRCKNRTLHHYALVKTTHVHSATCNVANYSLDMVVLPSTGASRYNNYRWRHQSGIFRIPVVHWIQGIIARGKAARVVMLTTQIHLPRSILL